MLHSLLKSLFDAFDWGTRCENELAERESILHVRGSFEVHVGVFNALEQETRCLFNLPLVYRTGRISCAIRTTNSSEKARHLKLSAHRRPPLDVQREVQSVKARVW